MTNEKDRGIARKLEKIVSDNWKDDWPNWSAIFELWEIEISNLRLGEQKLDAARREKIAECVRSLETDFDNLLQDTPNDYVHKQDAYFMLDRIDSLLTAEPEPTGTCRYTLSANKAPYPRVVWDCECGLQYAKMDGYETDEFGNPGEKISIPSGHCMKCHREIVATEPNPSKEST